MTLTAKMFQPVGGEIYTHLHENKMTGCPRALYWSATVRFAPFKVEQEAVDATATIEWLNFDDRRLSGKQKTATPKHQSHGEASLYTFMHQASDDWSCTLDFTRSDNNISFDYAMTVEAYAFEAKPLITLTGHALLAFDGIILVKGNLPENPDTADAARALIDPYFDLSAYHCVESEWQFVFHPNRAAT